MPKSSNLPWTVLALAALAFLPVACGPDAGEEPAEAPPAETVEATVNIVIETAIGEIEVELYPERAPLSVAQFLRYVDGGHYEGAAFYRATHTAGGDAHDVVQGGLRSLPMLVRDARREAAEEPPFPPIPHETTHDTGIRNERGTLAYARSEPGTANSEIFFNVGDNFVLDTDAGDPTRDGYGYATFGRVVGGMEVLEEIHGLPTDAPAASRNGPGPDPERAGTNPRRPPGGVAGQAPPTERKRGDGLERRPLVGTVARSATNRVSLPAKKRTDGLERRPLGSSPGGARHSPPKAGGGTDSNLRDGSPLGVDLSKRK